MLDEQEGQNAPDGFDSIKAVGKELAGLTYRIQVSPLDCTGCGNCVEICPAKTKALVLSEAAVENEVQSAMWEYAMKLSNKEDKISNKFSVKNSQFIQPLFEFSGACPGCGETPYIKLLTQLFGDRMMITNATGCSSIYGGSAPAIPYTTNSKGQGPTWANSLFEDNAEYGYGQYLGVQHQRSKIADEMRQAIQKDVPQELKDAFAEWIENMNHAEGSKIASQKVIDALEKIDLNRMNCYHRFMPKKIFL